MTTQLDGRRRVVLHVALVELAARHANQRANQRQDPAEPLPLERLDNFKLVFGFRSGENIDPIGQSVHLLRLEVLSARSQVIAIDGVLVLASIRIEDVDVPRDRLGLCGTDTVSRRRSDGHVDDVVAS